MRSFEHSTKVLIAAYLNDTLEHGYCTACAVAEATGRKIRKGGYHCFTDGSVSHWDAVFVTSLGDQQISLSGYDGAAKAEIDATGYTWRELAKIEYAFETCPHPNFPYTDSPSRWEEEHMYNGLVAVFNVLAEIHKVEDTIRTEALVALAAAKA